MNVSTVLGSGRAVNYSSEKKGVGGLPVHQIIAVELHSGKTPQSIIHGSSGPADRVEALMATAKLPCRSRAKDQRHHSQSQRRRKTPTLTPMPIPKTTLMNLIQTFHLLKSRISHPPLRSSVPTRHQMSTLSMRARKKTPGIQKEQTRIRIFQMNL